MKSYVRHMARFAAAVVELALILAAIGVTLAAMKGGSMVAWTSSMLIFGGLTLVVVLGLMSTTTASPVHIWSRDLDGIKTKQRLVAPLVMLVPAGVFVLGLLVRAFL